MFEMRPFLFLRDGLTAGISTPVIFDVLNREGKEVAKIHRDGTKWRIQADHSDGEARFNSTDEALASL
jgi:hypothetical protein